MPPTTTPGTPAWSTTSAWPSVPLTDVDDFRSGCQPAAAPSTWHLQTTNRPPTKRKLSEHSVETATACDNSGSTEASFHPRAAHHTRHSHSASSPEPDQA